MIQSEIKARLSGHARREIDQLIYKVWASESAETNDVDMLVAQGSSVIDPLDSISTHVLVRTSQNQIIGYGRIAVAHTPEDFGAAIAEIGISYLSYPVAYISRLVVHPDFRGQGIASMIHQERIKIATFQGVKKIYGWAVGDKPRSSLSQAGFSEVAIKEGFKTSWYQTQRLARLVEMNTERLDADGEFRLPRAST